MRKHIVSCANEAALMQGFSRITVSDVCCKANISRQTFYRYFSGKMDLAVWVVALVVEDAFIRIGEDLTWEDAIELIFDRFPLSATSIVKEARNADRDQKGTLSLASRISEIIERLVWQRCGMTRSRMLQFQINAFPLVFVTLLMRFFDDEAWRDVDSRGRAEFIASFVPAELKRAMSPSEK